MSVGTSPLELAKYLKCLWEVAMFLKNGAVQSFARCAQTYEDYVIEAWIIAQGCADNSYLRHRLEAAHGLLQTFFHGIEEFMPYLGKERRRSGVSWLTGVIAKVRWAIRKADLEQLQADLKNHLDHFMRIRIESGLSSVKGSVNQTELLARFRSIGIGLPKSILGDYFVLDTAWRDVHKFFFLEISSWADFHEHLLEMFKIDEPGREIIEEGSYVLYNTTSDRYILPTSPYIKDVRPMIGAGDRIKMSVIFSDKDIQLDRKCAQNASEKYEGIVAA